MNVLKIIQDLGAVVAWSPLKHMPNVIAVATKEGGGGGFDNYGGELSLHSLNLSDVSGDTQIIASIKTPARFSSLAWGPGNYKGGAFALGIIAGGMADGTIQLWDVNALLRKADSQPLPAIKRHLAAVRCLHFNPHVASAHLLGAGSADGDISIINLENPSAPSVASPLTKGQLVESEITSIAWNTDVPYILATGTVAGTVVVWDLKENKPWCMLRDPHRASVSDICWNPSDGLYLVTACDDDARPVIRLWDLRSSTSTPLAELTGGHTRGLLCVDWSPHDPTLLVSTGKDSRTLLWDIRQARPIADVPANVSASSGGSSSGSNSAALGGGGGVGGGGSGGNATAAVGGLLGGGGSASASSIFQSQAGAGGGFDGSGGGLGSSNSASSIFAGGGAAAFGGIGGGSGRRYLARWSKYLPGLLATCSFDRKVVIHGLTALGPANTLSGDAAASNAAAGASALTPSGLDAAMMRHPPRWLRRPCGASFGFGGRLVSFSAPKAAAKGELRAEIPRYAKGLQTCAVAVEHDQILRATTFAGELAAVEGGGMA